MTETPSWDWLRGQVLAALDAYLALVEGTDGGRKVPGLEWTVAELTAHLASLPGVYRAQDEIGQAFEPPDDFARFSVEQRSHIDTSDLAEVAALLRAEVTGLLDELDRSGDPDGSRWLYGQATTHRNLAATMLNELIVHGQDLAALGGQAPELSRAQANAILPALFALMPVFVDPAKAARAAGVYHLSFRGGDDWQYRIGEGGDLAVERGRPDRPDAHLRADPVTFILVGLGRRNPLVAALTGRMLVWGRRPWKFAATADLSVDGI